MDYVVEDLQIDVNVRNTAPINGCVDVLTELVEEDEKNA